MKYSSRIIMRIWIWISFVFILVSCSNGIRNLKDEGSFNESKKGLLIGNIQLKQGFRTLIPGDFGGSERLQIQNIKTGKEFSYEWGKEEKVFFLPLLPGEYRLISIVAYNVGARRAPDAQPPPYLIKLFNMEIGKIKTSGGGRFEVAFPFTFFSVKPHEASYVGTLLVVLPDPVPSDHIKAAYEVVDEGEKAALELRERFPKINFVKRLLVKSQSQ